MLSSLCRAEALTAASPRKQMQSASTSTYRHPAGWAASLQKPEYQYNKLRIKQKHDLSSLLYYTWLHHNQPNSDKKTRQS